MLMTMMEVLYPIGGISNHHLFYLLSTPQMPICHAGPKVKKSTLGRYLNGRFHFK